MAEEQATAVRGGFWRAVRANLFSWPTLLTVVGLLVLEVGLRLADFPPPIEKAVLEVDPFLLWDMPPGQRSEQGVVVNVNSRGMRGPDFVVPKPSGTRRILALGDSSVYGFGVEDSEVFTSVMQKELGSPVEVLNGAVGGYSTIQSLRFLYRNIRDIDPDLILIANLWSDNNFDSFVDRELLEAYSGHKPVPTHGLYRYLSRSQLFKSLDYMMRYQQLHQEGHRLTWMPGHGKPDGRRRVELNDYARNLDKMVQLAKEQGGEAMFLILANKEDAEGSGAPFKAWDPYRQAMRDTATRYGSFVVDLPEVLTASKQAASALFWDQMHPTALGHKLIGEAVVKELKARGWPEKPIMRNPDGGPITEYSDPFLTAGVIKAVGAVLDSAFNNGAQRNEPPMPMNLGQPPMPMGPGNVPRAGPIPIGPTGTLPSASGAPGAIPTGPVPIGTLEAAQRGEAAMPGAGPTPGPTSVPGDKMVGNWNGSDKPGAAGNAEHQPGTMPGGAAGQGIPISPGTVPTAPANRNAVKYSDMQQPVKPLLRQGLPSPSAPNNAGQ